MRILNALIVTVICTYITTAWAQEDEPVQMDEVRCVHLIDLSEDEFGFLLVWWDGYFSRFTGNTLLSENNLERLGNIIFQECQNDARVNIMDMLTEYFTRDVPR